MLRPLHASAIRLVLLLALLWPGFALADWASFQRRCVAADGRVVDSMHGGTSTSTGQGWGMLLAALAEAAQAMARDLLRCSTRRSAGRVYLLPGAEGFASPRGLILNPGMVNPHPTAAPERQSALARRGRPHTLSETAGAVSV